SDNIAHGSEPSPPALDTAIASTLPCTPAMGAWMIGSSMPRRWRIRSAPKRLERHRDVKRDANRQCRLVDDELRMVHGVSRLPVGAADAYAGKAAGDPLLVAGK